MASYHLSVQIISRSTGRSSVRAAAYRAGERLSDLKRGGEADFSRRRGVAHTEIIAPEGSASWLLDRQALWNGVEQAERRADAQLARELNIALPAELTDEQRLALVRAFVRQEFTSRGMVADVAIHRPVPEKGDDPRNHHVHIMLPLRQATAEGLRGVKTREWNSDAVLVSWRAAWAAMQNDALRAHGHSQSRVDHRNLVAQREAARAGGDRQRAEELDREPELHVGPRATNAARRGYQPASRNRTSGLRMQPRAEASEPRQGRPWRPPARTSRSVRYQEIDHGSRFEENLRRITRNLTRLDAKIGRWQERTVRARSRRQYFGRVEHETRSVSVPTMARPRWRPPNGGSLPGPAFGDGGRRAHARRRQALVAALIAELDRVLSGLFRLRGRHIERRSALAKSVRRGRPDGFGRPGRARRRPQDR
ncbi:MobQ family relaxase [Mesorhizobium sp. M0589]|uniref:MobQ family relaxase n=1 Tax=Mesorhizobium sp. M0589 TaxID=2956965 RepID=UPI0033377058